MLEKTTKRGTTRVCVAEGCGHREDVHATASRPPASGTGGDAGRLAR
jgi:hypothetical protein